MQILLNQRHKIISRIFSNHPSLTKKIYFLIRNTTLDTKTLMFQYKVLHNALYVNKMLFKFGKVISPRCSFCKLHEETIMHLFYDCLIVKRIWNQLKSILSNNLKFSDRYATECHLRILWLRYEWTPYLRPLTTYFQNVNL